MPRAIELIREGKNKELWQMCCGFLNLSIDEFMNVQERLLGKQLELLSNSVIGKKIMGGARPQTVGEFREMVPLTTYKDYCPELIEKIEDILPVKPYEWVHTSGRSGEYPCKWIPLTADFLQEMSVISFGIAILSTCKEWGDTSKVVECPRIINAMAPRPYMSGAMGYMLDLQVPSRFMPPLDGMDSLSFEDRVQLGFKQALSQGLDGFCGLSLVLVKIGERFREASNKASVLPYVKQPRAALRLARGLLKSKIARRPMLPRDLWTVRGIISGGLDSWVYKDKIMEYWGRYPLDVYVGSEGGVYATQTWDYEGMTFVPNLNFFEFIPEDELLKWEMDRSYRMKTLLMNEVKAGEKYEIVMTNFHGGAMIRYRPGDMVRITSLRNEKLGIDIPQMVFEQRVDGLLDFVFVRLTEKTIWEAIESTGIPYEDWIAYKKDGEAVLSLFIELKDDSQENVDAIARAIYKHVTESQIDAESLIPDEYARMIGFRVETTILPRGTFASYTTRRQAEGADLAHLKPPHIQPSQETITLLVAKPERVRAVVTPENQDETVSV